MMVKRTNNIFTIQPTWNDVYKNNNVFNLPWVDKTIKPELKDVIDNLPIKTGRALDIGCGLGQVSRYLAEVGFNVTAIDISTEAISWAKKLNNTGKAINYQATDSVSFKTELKFELIIDFLHIHDIPIENFNKYLINTSSLLRENGYLIIATFQDDNTSMSLFSRKSNYVDQLIYYYPSITVFKVLDSEFSLIDNRDFIAGNCHESYNSYILCLQKTINKNE